MPTDCVFCRIVAGQSPARVVHQGDRVIAIDDINPQAPMHVLVMPRRHIATLNDLAPGDDDLVGEMIRCGAAIARERGVSGQGYRAIFNCNRGAGQSVYHIHLHVLGGRRMAWPPG